MVGVFGAKMVVSFRSSGVGLKAEIFGQFRTSQVGLEMSFRSITVSIVLKHDFLLLLFYEFRNLVF